MFPWFLLYLRQPITLNFHSINQQILARLVWPWGQPSKLKSPAKSLNLKQAYGIEFVAKSRNRFEAFMLVWDVPWLTWKLLQIAGLFLLFCNLFYSVCCSVEFSANLDI